MPCKIDLEITLYHLTAEPHTRWLGTATCYMHNPPVPGTYFGSIVTLVVRAVHYLGIADGSDKDHYKVSLMTLSERHGYDSNDNIKRTIREQTSWLKWEFVEQPGDDNESEDLQDGE